MLARVLQFEKIANVCNMGWKTDLIDSHRYSLFSQSILFDDSLQPFPHLVGAHGIGIGHHHHKVIPVALADDVCISQFVSEEIGEGLQGDGGSLPR